MKKVLIAFLLLGYSSMAHADEWVNVLHKETGDCDCLDLGNWWVTQDNNGVPVVVGRMRARTSAGAMYFRLDHITIKDCKAGAGVLVASDFNGNAIGQGDFVFNGGNGFSIEAEALCALAIRQP